MAKIAREYNTEMGETGAGIENAADIDMSVTNAFTTKWGTFCASIHHTCQLISVQNPAEISAKCPWYFDMRNLIGQRPNLVPTGVGHSGTAVAPGVIIPGPASAGDTVEATTGEEDQLQDDHVTPSTPEEWELTPPLSPDPRTYKRNFDNAFADEEQLTGSGDEYHLSSPVASESAPPDHEEEEGEQREEQDDEDGEVETHEGKKQKKQRKQPAKPSTSTPAVSTPAVAPKAAKKTKIAEFSEIAKSKERTRQKEIELATLRTCQQMKAVEVKGRIFEKKEDRRRAKEEARREERMKKLEMKQEKMRYAHEVRMAATGAGRMSASTSHDTSNDAHSRASGSHYSSSEYTGRDGLDGFNENAAPGSSTGGADFDYSNMDFSFSTNGSPAI
jgi:hypothetical protein